MIPKLPTDPVQRAQRKENLLLASALMRDQAQASVDDLGGRADGLVRRVLVVRDWFSHPAVLAAASTGAAFFAASGRQRQGRLWRGLRWAWLAWRVLKRR